MLTLGSLDEPTSDVDWQRLAILCKKIQELSASGGKSSAKSDLSTETLDLFKVTF